MLRSWAGARVAEQHLISVKLVTKLRYNRIAKEKDDARRDKLHTELKKVDAELEKLYDVEATLSNAKSGIGRLLRDSEFVEVYVLAQRLVGAASGQVTHKIAEAVAPETLLEDTGAEAVDTLMPSNPSIEDLYWMETETLPDLRNKVRGRIDTLEAKQKRIEDQIRELKDRDYWEKLGQEAHEGEPPPHPEDVKYEVSEVLEARVVDTESGTVVGGFDFLNHEGYGTLGGKKDLPPQ